MNALADILRLSSINQEAFAALVLTPLIPPLSPSSHDSSYGGTANDEPGPSRSRDQDNGDDKWHRGMPEPAVLSTIDLAVHGDGTPGREGLRVRAAAAALFEVRNFQFGDLDDC